MLGGKVLTWGRLHQRIRVMETDQRISYLGRGRLYLEVRRVGQQVLGKLHSEARGLATVAMSMQGLSASKQDLERGHKMRARRSPLALMHQTHQKYLLCASP